MIFVNQQRYVKYYESCSILPVYRLVMLSVMPVLVMYDTMYVFSSRMLQNAAVMASRVFDSYNYQDGFLNGGYIRMFSVFRGTPFIESQNIEAGSLVVAPVSFVGDLWRNWGWSGVITGTFMLGVLYQFIQLKLFRKKTVVTVTFQVILLLGAVLIIHGNVLGVITTSILLFGILMGACVNYYNERRRGALPENRGAAPANGLAAEKRSG